jgi:hypothetical protein
MQETVALEAEQIEIEVSIGDDTRRHVLEATGGDDLSAGHFEVVDKALVEALKAAGQGVTATLIVAIDDQVYRTMFEKHEHGHGHEH